MTDKEKAEYYDQWHEYFEPLARVRHEAKKAVAHYKSIIDYSDKLTMTIMLDPEVHNEIYNLIQTMLNEVVE